MRLLQCPRPAAAGPSGVDGHRFLEAAAAAASKQDWNWLSFGPHGISKLVGGHHHERQAAVVIWWQKRRNLVACVIFMGPLMWIPALFWNYNIPLLPLVQLFDLDTWKPHYDIENENRILNGPEPWVVHFFKWNQKAQKVSFCKKCDCTSMLHSYN
jgi:hypothetical protein